MVAETHVGCSGWSYEGWLGHHFYASNLDGKLCSNSIQSFLSVLYAKKDAQTKFLRQSFKVLNQDKLSRLVLVLELSIM